MKTKKDLEKKLRRLNKEIKVFDEEIADVGFDDNAWYFLRGQQYLLKWILKSYSK